MKTIPLNRLALLVSCLLVPISGLAAAATSTGNQPVPATRMPKVPGLDKFKLYENAHGHILCADEETATRMFAALDRAVKELTTSFGKAPGKGIYYQDRPDIADAATQLAAELRATWTAPAAMVAPAPDPSTAGQPILSAAELAGIKQQFKDETKKQMPGITDDMFEESFKKALPGLLAQMGCRLAPDPALDPGPLGVKLLAAAYRPAPPPATPRGVWLDEVAAGIAKGGIPAHRDAIAKLATGGKPLLPVAKLTTAAAPEGDDFRTQSLALAEFLTEKSGRPAVLGDIAAAGAAGKPFAAWLAARGPANKLGADLAKLDTAWQAWVGAKSGKAPKPAGPAAPGAAGSLKPGSKISPDAIAAADFIKGEAPKQWEQDKIYFIECWATWCAPCVQAIPHVNEMHNKYKDRGLRVIGMNVMEDGREKVADFVNNKGDGMAYPVAYDSQNGRFQSEWLTASGQRGIPRVFVVRNGELLFHCHPMMINNSMVEKLLAGGQAADTVVNTMRSGAK